MLLVKGVCLVDNPGLLSKEGAESPVGLFAVVVDGAGHGGGRWRETAQLGSVVGDGDFQSL